MDWQKFGLWYGGITAICCVSSELIRLHDDGDVVVGLLVMGGAMAGNIALLVTLRDCAGPVVTLF